MEVQSKILKKAVENRRKKLIARGDLVIIVTGLAFTTGSTNLIKIHRVGMDD